MSIKLLDIFCGSCTVELYIDKHSCTVYHFIPQNLFATPILILVLHEMASTTSSISNVAELSFQH